MSSTSHKTMSNVMNARDKAQRLADSLTEMAQAFKWAEMGHGLGWADVCKQAAEAILLQQPCADKPVAWLEEVTITSGNDSTPHKEWRVTQNPPTSNAPRKALYLVSSQEEHKKVRKALKDCLDVFDAIGGTPPDVWETARKLLRHD